MQIFGPRKQDRGQNVGDKVALIAISARRIFTEALSGPTAQMRALYNRRRHAAAAIFNYYPGRGSLSRRSGMYRPGNGGSLNGEHHAALRGQRAGGAARRKRYKGH